MNRIIKNIFGNRFKNIEAYKINKIKIDLRDITNDIIKSILLKQKDGRSNEDIATLKNYILLKSKFTEKLIKDHIDESMQEIIIILSMINAFYKQIKKKDEIIYNINDKSEYFYIIMEGEVSILGIEKVDCEMNSEEYYKLVLNLKKKDEKYLLEKTLEENKINFPIDLEDIYILDKILVKIYLLSKNNIESLKGKLNYIEIILDKVGLKNSDFGIETYQEKLNERNNKILVENELIKQDKEEHKENKEKQKALDEFNIEEELKIIKENEEIILQQLKNIVPDNLCKKYHFLINTPELPITYFRYKEEKVLKDLDYFGENEVQFLSNKVVSKSDKTKLIYFKHDIYNDIITHMKSKFIGNQVDFLLDNFFFSSIYKGFFDKIYLKYFEYSKYFMNQIIIEENEPIRYIYFVKNGNVRIYSNRSIIQNHILIEIINNILKRKNNILMPEKSIQNALNISLYPEMKGDFELIKKEIKKRNNIHLMTFQEKQCIGFECFYFGFNSLYQAIAVSDKVEVYKISIEKLIKILTIKNKKALYDFARQSEKAIKILLERIVKTNNMLLFKYSTQNKELFNQISYIVGKAINIIQAENGEIKSKNIINSKKIQQKKVEEIDKINNINDNDRYIKRKSYFNDNNDNKNDEEIKKGKYNKNKKEEEKKNINIFNKYDLTAQIKIFDQKANSLKEKYRELQRESDELERISKAENKKINSLKKENIKCQNFFKLSQGEKRIFIKSRNNSINLNDIHYHYSLRAKSILYNNKKNKNKTLISFYKGKNFFREIYPFNSRYNNYKPYKYDISKTMLVNKKIFEYSVFKKNPNSSCDVGNKVKIYRYKSSGDVDVDNFNLKKKNMFVINCQDLYNKY